MNEKLCYSVLSEVLDQIEKQYFLEKGSYRIAFYIRESTMICFSIIAADKSRIRIENNVLISFVNLRTTIINYNFRYADFMQAYFNKNLDEFNSLKINDRIRLTVETINEVYIDLAIIPTQLL